MMDAHKPYPSCIIQQDLFWWCLLLGRLQCLLSRRVDVPLFLLNDVLSYSPRFVAYASTRQAKTSLNKAASTGKALYSGFSTAFVRSMSQTLLPGYDSMGSGVWSLQTARRKGSWLLDSERGCNLGWCATKTNKTSATNNSSTWLSCACCAI